MCGEPGEANEGIRRKFVGVAAFDTTGRRSWAGDVRRLFARKQHDLALPGPGPGRSNWWFGRAGQTR